ncbi:MAG: phenylalanine--tRNA ligase subunit alpha [Spirochaetales bacterium]|nr:phenylalanine--tRNA ligase subunit alpha [Spirochaetales bacterium]
MDVERLIKTLHPLEVRILLHFQPGQEIDAGKVQAELGFNLGQCNQAFSWLAAKELLEETSRRQRMEYTITELGREYRQQGTPEARVVGLLQAEGPLTLPEIAARLGLENRDVGSAFGTLSREGVLAMDPDKRVSVAAPGPPGSVQAVAGLLALFDHRETVGEEELSGEQAELLRGLARKRGAERGLFRGVEREEVGYRLRPESAPVQRELETRGMTGEEIGVITPEVLRGGSWRRGSFRSYNIQLPPQRVLGGRKNPYVEFLEHLKDKLTALGFEEYDGPLLETEFWNCDALFMPQFHPARDIHDVYYLKSPTHARAIAQPYLDQVGAAHENGWTTGSLGWRYPFDRDFTRRMILRSQGTVLSAKALTTARVPGRYFGVVRCFRYDKVDATHLADFYQTEGIALGHEVNLKTLLGLLKMFAVEVAGAREFKFVPGYFPFTEPSVEIHIRHPELGWFELGGSGIFRPEVTRPLGVDVPVLAWGLGIDRMALVALGLNDLRDLFTADLEQVRLRRRHSRRRQQRSGEHRGSRS